MIKITKPVLLLDENICKANISNMVTCARRNSVQLVPHFKTHQSAEVGEWFREQGVEAITVTSVKMATFFAARGWIDITIAFPFNVLELDDLKALQEVTRVKVFINSVETAVILKQQVERDLDFYIEVDTGDGRSGVEASKISEIEDILKETGNSNLKFFGFYTHPGHTYAADSGLEVEQITGKVLENLKSLKWHFREVFPDLKLAFGDTPSCSIVNDLKAVDSIHPGNFVFYDLVQNRIGANKVEQIAICLSVPVVAVHLERQEVVVHSGWVHQGKDSLSDSEGNHFGQVVQIGNKNWTAPIPGAKVTKLSQEHGVIRLPKEMIQKIKVGEVLGILPVHACATAVMMREFWTLEGERIKMMP